VIPSFLACLIAACTVHCIALFIVLCAEITQTVISSVAEAAAWIKSTFYYTRLKKNPRAYGLGKAKNLKELEQMLLEQCTR
jgi:hypothetical protein